MIGSILIFLFKNMIIQFLKSNFQESKNALFWIKIDFLYNSNKVK